MAPRKKKRSRTEKLRSDLGRMNAEIRRCDETVVRTQTTKHNLVAERDRIAAELARGSHEIHVTDHALIRYLERVKGLDRAALEAEIVTDELQGLVDQIGGSGRIPLKASGFTVVLRDYAILSLHANENEG